MSNNNNLRIPSGVHEEFCESNLNPQDVECIENSFDVIEVNGDPLVLSFFDHNPSYGEYWVLAYAYHNREDYAVIDEGKGRFIAEYLGLNLIGTIGILRIMRDEQIISRELLELSKVTILEGSFYLDEDLKAELRSL